LIPKQLDSSFAYLNTMKTIDCRTIKDILLKRYQSKSKLNTNSNNNDSALALEEEYDNEEDIIYYANNRNNNHGKHRRKQNIPPSTVTN
jgi:hypothetical protein